MVNITQNSLVFTYSTLNCLSDEYYTDDTDIAIIKNTPAYIIVDVENIDKKETPKDFPIKGSDIYYITGKIRKVMKNDENAMPFNRGLSALIECLINFSRHKMVDEEKRKEYMKILIENQRIINKVSDEKTKKGYRRFKRGI